MVGRAGACGEGGALVSGATLPAFTLGQVVATPGALAVLKRTRTNPAELIRRHLALGQGALGSEDREGSRPPPKGQRPAPWYGGGATRRSRGDRPAGNPGPASVSPAAGRP